KNKVAPPFRQAEFDLMYGEGISKEGCILDLGVEEGIVKKSGAWYTYENERLGQGREAAKDLLKTTPDLRDEIEYKLRDTLGLLTATTPVPKSLAREAKDTTVA
ncbi:MAG: DNA recombination/repair protein RecA, partial [Coriobacteriaceae bacterium]|nr:DNA recombination/repair protein RecA [Coriobacteriaceae bacterium]